MVQIYTRIQRQTQLKLKFTGNKSYVNELSFTNFGSNSRCTGHNYASIQKFFWVKIG